MANKEQVRMELFGPDPGEVAEARRAQQMQHGANWASMPAGRGGVATAAMAGNMLGEGIAGAMGYQDPAMKRAQALQEAQQEVESSGVSLLENPMQYYKTAYDAMAKRGLQDEAMQVRSIMQQEAAAAQEASLKNRQVGAAETTANASMLRAATEANQADTASTSDFITLAPSGTTEKGTGQEQTFNMKDPEQAKAAKDLLSQGYVDTSKLPTPPKDSGTVALARAFQEQTAAMRDMYAGKEYAEESAKANVNRKTEIYADASVSASILRDINNIDAALDMGQTNFGAIAEGRRSLASALQTFAPGLGEDINQALGIDLVSFDAVQRSSKTVLAEMARKFSGGNRMTAAALQTLESAGPSVFLTNEGLRSVTNLFRKTSKYHMDRANYLANLEESSGGGPVDVERVMTQWEINNANNPEYYMTNAELRDIKSLEKKNKMLRDLQDGASDLPVVRAPDGSLAVNRSTINAYPDGKVFFFGGEYYKKIQGVLKKVTP